jgi:hypothetical protein
MSIYRQGMKVQVISGDKRIGEFATVSQARDYGVFAYVGDDKFETYFETGDITPAIMVELTATPTGAPAAAGAGDRSLMVDFSPSEFERGWDSATQSMLGIIERVLENPEYDDHLHHIVSLVANMRVDYPKHGVRQAASADGEGR